MASDELLDRIDGHLARSATAMEAFTAASARHEAAAARNTDAFDRNKEAFDRNTDAFGRMMVVLDRHEQALDDNHEFMRELTVRTELRDLRDESRAQRGALLRVVDKLK